MREIKFRAWDKNKKRMIYFDFHNIDDCFVWEHQSSMQLEEDTPVMQFTGLTDENGKEIYEGDIVKGIFTYDETQVLAPIIFWNTGYYVGYDNGETRNVTALCSIKDLEIVGNIYESD